MIKFNNVLITGASSGIGRALAIELSQYSQNLFLCGRHQANLQETLNLCKNNNANIHTKIFDVKDQIACKNYIETIEQNYALDLIIANAGISAGTAQGTENITQIKEIFDTNLYGAINIINPALEYLKKRQNGQIVLISSLAGFIGLPSSPAYSASKSALRVLGEALRLNLLEYNIKVNIVCPGYVKTPMTAVNKFPMPFMVNSDDAAKKIIKGIANNQALIIFPVIFYLVIRFLSILPRFLSDMILKKLPKKKSL